MSAGKNLLRGVDDDVYSDRDVLKDTLSSV